jgi:hypothetical protein
MVGIYILEALGNMESELTGHHEGASDRTFRKRPRFFSSIENKLISNSNAADHYVTHFIGIITPDRFTMLPKSTSHSRAKVRLSASLHPETLLESHPPHYQNPLWALLLSSFTCEKLRSVCSANDETSRFCRTTPTSHSGCSKVNSR